MIHAFPSKGATVLTKNLVSEVLKELNAFGIQQFILQYYDYYRLGFIAIFALLIWIVVIAYYIRRRRKLLQHK